MAIMSVMSAMSDRMLGRSNFLLSVSPATNRYMKAIRRALIKGAQYEKAQSQDHSSHKLVNDRFGDFCFGLIRDTPASGQSWFETPFVELDGFERNGVFPFFKLPREIRDKILGMILRDCYFEGDDGKKEGFIRLNVRPQFSRNLLHTISPHIMTTLRREAETDFCGAYDREDYCMVLDHRLQSHLQEECATDWKLGDFVRKLSHVNSQFRRELASYLWDKVRLEGLAMVLQSGPAQRQWPLMYFLLDRPSLIARLKSLDLTLKFNIWRVFGADYPYEILAHISFDNHPCSRVIAYLANLVDLENLNLDVHLDFFGGLDDEDVDVVIRAEWFQLCAQAFRKIKVSKQFHLTCILVGESSSRTRQIIDSLTPKFVDALMPDTLRVMPAPTEKDLYLKSRLLEA